MAAVDVVNVPLPLAAYTVIDGDVARFVNVPVDSVFSCACHVPTPVVLVTVAPGPADALEPYVIVSVPPPASVTPDTVTVRLDTPTVPVDDVVYPAADPVVDGALHPVGTTSVTLPPDIPPVAAVYVNVIVLPDELAERSAVDADIEPVPSGA